MVSTQTPPGRGDEPRAGFLREILGIALIFIALLVALSLVSTRVDADWTGPVGRGLAGAIDFIVGRYVAFAWPVMLAFAAVRTLRGAVWTVPGRDARAWVRLGGAALLTLSACALLTLTAPTASPTPSIVSATDSAHSARLDWDPLADDLAAPPAASTGETPPTDTLATEAERRTAEMAAQERAFQRGGLIGSVLISAEGAHLAGLLGHAGAAILFACLGLIGLVLFTETFLKDIVWVAWRALGGAVRWGVGRMWVQRSVQAIRQARWLHVAVRTLEWMFLLPVWRWVRAYLSEVHFDRAIVGHIVPSEPILELSLAEGPSGARDHSVLPRPQNEMTPLCDESATALTATPVVELSRSAGALDGAGHAVQAEFELFPTAYELPSLDLLNAPPASVYVMSDSEKTRLSRLIETTLEQFKIEVEVVEVVQGPVITRFAMKVAQGIRLSKILALDSELAMALKAPHVRILAPIPERSAVGIEVPNPRANPVVVRQLIDTPEFEDSESPLSFVLGQNISGEAVVCDLARMPHLLIAGATGSGKSVCLNTIIASLLFANTPDRVKFVMVDPKRVELSIYQSIPHLIAPVVSETRKAAAALAWCIEIMEKRYELFSELGVRNLDAYNALLHANRPSEKLMGRDDLKPLPHVVIIIDELADLMMVARNEIEEYVIRLGQMARAVGMHLILATQRPSVNVITGIIKANFPSRIAFQVSSKVDSRTILDINGAETLIGRGDMLYSPGGSKPMRVQGAFISDAEVERLADYIRAQETAHYEKEDFEARPTASDRAKAQLEIDDPEAGPGVLAAEGRAAEAPLAPADTDSVSDDDLYRMALDLILESRKASVSYIQRRLKIGYARAGRIMDLLEEQGIVGPYQGSKPRDLLVDPQEYLAEQSVEVSV